MTSRQYHTVPGARLWMEDTGGRLPPVVLVHPHTGSSESWQRQVPAFTAAGLRCVRYDRRGYRRSVPERGWRPTARAADLAAVLDAHGLADAHVVGAGGGACDALQFAVTRPERVRSLVVSNSYGGIADRDYAALVRRIWSPAYDTLPPEVLELSASYRGADPAGVRRWRAVRDRARGEAYPDNVRVRGVWLRELERLPMPVLVLAGDGDLLAPPPLMRRMAERVPHGEFQVIAGSGHASFWERADQWNQTVVDFLTRAGAAQRR
jgi:pimeloyl-ACP methyl ester carboxylesterase